MLVCLLYLPFMLSQSASLIFSVYIRMDLQQEVRNALHIIAYSIGSYYYIKEIVVVAGSCCSCGGGGKLFLISLKKKADSGFRELKMSTIDNLYIEC